MKKLTRKMVFDALYAASDPDAEPRFGFRRPTAIRLLTDRGIGKPFATWIVDMLDGRA